MHPNSVSATNIIAVFIFRIGFEFGFLICLPLDKPKQFQPMHAYAQAPSSLWFLLLIDNKPDFTAPIVTSELKACKFW